MNFELDLALMAYRAAVKEQPRYMEAGWIDDFQRRRERLIKATNKLLEVAAKEENG